MKQIHTRLLLTLLCLLVLIGGVWWAVARQRTESSANNTLQVTASYYPLYEFAKHVAGDSATVSVITPAGTEPHDFEPAATTLAKAQSSDIFIYNGVGMEPWAAGFLQTFQGEAVKASDGITLRSIDGNGSQKDPHFWLDPVDAQHIVTALQQAFSKADPKHGDTYARNAAAYNAKLAQLDADFTSRLQHCGQHMVVTSHDAFGYLAQRYGFTVQSITGLSPEEEPSASHLAAVADIVRQHDIKYIFFESLVSPRLADTIATETGAKTLVFDPIEGVSDADQKEGKNYVSIQKQNLQNLVTALACR